jgi:hypothetical protein
MESQNSKNPILRFLQGDLSKSTLLNRIIPITLIVIGVTTLISNLLFPTAYDWRYMVISALTNAEDNPNGFWILSLGMTIAGFLLIPLPGYFQKRLGKICRGTAGFGSFFFLIGIIGLILVGLLYEGMGLPDRTHENLALVAFVGLIFGCFFYGFPILKDRLLKYHGRQQFDMKLFVPGAIMMWVIFFGMAGSALYLEVVPNDWGWVGIDWIGTRAPVLASFALWEWALFIALLVYLVLLIKLIPEKVESLGQQ